LLGAKCAWLDEPWESDDEERWSSAEELEESAEPESDEEDDKAES